MGSIIKKVKKGKPYYYAVESGRVNGKPRIVWQKYLGTIEAIVERVAGATPPVPKETVIFEAGGVAALLRIAERLGLMELINELVPKRDQGPSVGHYLLLAAINRALDPCSKLAIGAWYEQTVLRRLWRFPASAFSSPRFWDHMDRVSEQDIEAIEERLVPRVEAGFGINPQLLLYDTTNFFTFIATSNARSSLAQRGHSKAKRHDLRQVGLALLVSQDFQVPLLHKIYDGNIPDVSLFPRMARTLIARFAQLGGATRPVTLVFDKGNVSEEGMEELLAAGVPFLAALPASRLPEFIERPMADFSPVTSMPGTRAWAAPVELYAKACLGVVAYTESFFTQQLSGVTANMVKCEKKLLDLQKSLKKWDEGKARGKRPTAAGVRKSVAAILSPQFMKDWFRTTVEEENNLPRLRYEVDHAALQTLVEKRLGRTVLLSAHTDWSAAQTIEGYRSLARIEEVFKNMKNIQFLHWQPAWHWTDQKLRVHALYCVLALLLATLARKTAAEHGCELSLPALLEELTHIREVAILYPPRNHGPPQRPHRTLAHVSTPEKTRRVPGNRPSPSSPKGVILSLNCNSSCIKHPKRMSPRK